MRALVQRVAEASVHVDGARVGAIGEGLLVFLGVARDDADDDAAYIARKLLGLRVFEDDGRRMNRSVVDIDGSILLVSQFTLYADFRKGRRPGFDAAAPPETAEKMYQDMVARLATAVPVETGRFGARMEVRLLNSGPATFWIDSAER